jgi:hypothetical protein
LHEEKANLVSLRFLPPKSKVDMSFWLYGNKCLFASEAMKKSLSSFMAKNLLQSSKSSGKVFGISVESSNNP